MAADSDGDETTLKRAPTAADIAELGEPHHLNIPGDPLGDTCDYARDFAKLKREGKAPAKRWRERPAAALGGSRGAGPRPVGFER